MARRIVGLTSGRADYSLLVPLFELLQADPDFDLTVIAFGTHVSPYHGRTVRAIHEAGFNVREVETMILGDSEESVARAIGVTISRFSSLWSELAPDSIVALGDRYEMFAAAAASIRSEFPWCISTEEKRPLVPSTTFFATLSPRWLRCTVPAIPLTPNASGR